jgi:hypothetical protein
LRFRRTARSFRGSRGGKSSQVLTPSALAKLSTSPREAVKYSPLSNSFRNASVRLVCRANALSAVPLSLRIRRTFWARVLQARESNSSALGERMRSTDSCRLELRFRPRTIFRLAAIYTNTCTNRSPHQNRPIRRGMYHGEASLCIGPSK